MRLKLRRQKKNQPTEQTRGRFRYSYLFGLFVVALVVVNVFAAIQSSVDASSLVRIEAEITEVEKLNAELRDQVIMDTSLHEVARAVEDSDFTDPEHVIYINNDSSSVASLR